MIKRYVTGGSGFIGRHLMDKLGRMDGQTYGIDHSYFTKEHQWSCDQLFFLSTYGNMAHHTENYRAVKANVVDVLSVLKRFKGWFCYMSSSSVTLSVQTPYSRTKRAAEEILQALPELKSCIVRPYSVTGVGEQKEHLIPTLIRSCMEGEEMPFDPYPVHDFIDVEDVVDGLILLADRQVQGVFEFGTGVPRTNQDIRDLVEHFCQKKANVKLTQNIREYDSDDWFCKKPQFKPSKPIAQSISEMVEAYKREHA